MYIVAVFIIIIIWFVVAEAKRSIVQVKSYSQAYNNLIRLNDSVVYYYVEDKQLEFCTTLKSKRSLEKLDLEQLAIEKVSENISEIEDVFAKIEHNRKVLLDYLREYEQIYHKTTRQEYNDIVSEHKRYVLFSITEKLLYKKNKLPVPTIEKSGYAYAKYTSPAGRKSYAKYQSYSYGQLQDLLYKARHIEELTNAKKLQRKLREQRLKDLEKKEKTIIEKEREINDKIKEFEEATRGQIYSNDCKNVSKVQQQETGGLSITQKYKELKAEFESGQLSYEEYRIKRGKLFEYEKQ